MRLIILALAAVMTAQHSAHAQSPDLLVSASSNDHLWFVLKSRTGYVLCHRAAASTGPDFRALAALSTSPVALAAWDDRVWIIFPPSLGSDEPRRETFTLQVQYNPAVDMYISDPSGRLDAVASMPGLGNLAGFVGTAAGPVGLLVPPQRAAATVVAGEHSQASEPILDHPRLIQLNDQKWLDLKLPAEFKGTGDCLLAVGGADGQTLMLLASSPEDANRTSVFTRDSASGGWSKSEIAHNLRNVWSITSVGNQLAALIDEAGSNDLHIAYLRPDALLPLTNLSKPTGPFALAGLGGRMELIEFGSASRPTIRTISPISGNVSPRVELMDQPIGSRLWQVAVLLAIVISSILLVVLIRPASSVPLVVPKGMKLAGLDRRIAALAIDLLPGALVAIFLLHCTPADLLHPPAFSLELSQCIPYLAMALVTFIHSTLTEMIAATTLGKAVVGAKVISGDGSRPPPAMIVLRNVIKLIVLLVPPLALVALFNPNMQGMGDMVARTVVVRTSAESHKDDSTGT